MPFQPAISDRLYTAAQTRELDRLAIEEQGIPGIVLMKRAGRAAFEALLRRWPVPGLIHIFCGSGNNAGDGYIVAGLTAQKNLPVRIIQVGDPKKLQGDAARAHEFARQAKVEMLPWAPGLSLDEGVVVDALLGTGAKGAPRGDYAAAIRCINASNLPVLAVDLPSGLDADTGHCEGDRVRADLTVTFIGVKRGLLTGRAPAVVGELEFRDLDLPEAVYDAVPTRVSRLNPAMAADLLPPRQRDVHKGHFGHVLVIGGDLGTGGAALMAAESAARVGAGLVSVATRSEHCGAFLARRPELMVRGVDSPDKLKPLLSRATVVVIGPGLGQSDWAYGLLQAAVKSGLPLVVDADGLNLISRDPEAFRNAGKWVLTPHPGEASRLLGKSTGDVQADRFAAAEELLRRFGGAVVLKGAGTLVASDSDSGPRIGVADVGNPGMASGGMGDILSGVIGGLLAQGLSLAQAAELGVLLHGQAADLAAQAAGERGLLATDLLPHLHHLVNPS